MKHTPFKGWGLDARTRAAIDAGHPEWVELPSTARGAREAGEKLFFNATPCKQGHICPKRSDASRCVYCTRKITRRWQSKNEEKVKEYSRTNWLRVKSDPLRHKKDKDSLRAHQQRNPGYFAAKQMRRNATKLKATPPWLTQEQHDEINAIYEEAARLTKETGIVHHVDHIVPLRHPDVCGLHIPANLQVLTAEENLSKGNSFDGTMANEGWRDSLAIRV